MDLKTASEKELREYKVTSPKTKQELDDIIDALATRGHDYGTCVYAMSIAATATFYYMSHMLGVTGFQASCADLDILARTRNFKFGKLLNYENLLYPQYCDKDHFPSLEDIIDENIVKLGKMAQEKLKESDLQTSSNVTKHWKYLVEKAMLKKLEE